MTAKATKLVTLFVAASALSGCAGQNVAERLYGYKEANTSVEGSQPAYSPGPSDAVFAHGNERIPLWQSSGGTDVYVAQVYPRYFNVSSGIIPDREEDGSPLRPIGTIRFLGSSNGHRVPSHVSVCIYGSAPIWQYGHSFNERGEPLKRRIIGRTGGRVDNCPGTNSPWHLEFKPSGRICPTRGCFGFGL